MTSARAWNSSVAIAGSIAALLAAIPFSAHAAITCSLTAIPPVVWPGQPTVLRLVSSGAKTATVDNGVGTMPLNGDKETFSLSGKTTFKVTLSNASTSETTTCSTEVLMNDVPSMGGGGGGGSGLQQAMGALQVGAGALQLANAFGMQSALGGNNTANDMCTPYVPDKCGCNRILDSDGKCRPSSNMHECACAGTSNGANISGYCLGPRMCKGFVTSGGIGGAGGMGGSLGGGLQGLAGILQGINSLTGGGMGGGGGGGAALGAYPPGTCFQYYYVSVPSTNPCAIYQPGSSSDLLGGSSVIQPGVAGDLLAALGGDSGVSGALNTGTGVSISDLIAGGQTNQPQQTQVLQPGSTLTGNQTGQLKDSLSGDVKLGLAGATIFANLRQGLTEVAGFFGGSTFGAGGSQSALSRLCSARPWAASNFLGKLTPDTFFDALCKRAGYQVGQVQQTGGGGGTQTTTSFTTSQQAPVPVATTTGPYIPPEADIRAEPASVRLGSRTYIFWRSQGVSSCEVRGPSFTQDTLQGAGATVPITGPTIYAITCTAPDGTRVQDSVTVNLAI